MANDPSGNRREGIRLKDPLEILVDGDCLFIGNFLSKCSVCGEIESVQEWKGRRICTTCMEDGIDLSEK